MPLFRLKEIERVSANHRQACVCGCVRTQAVTARLELSSRSRSVKPASAPVSCPTDRKAHNGPSTRGLTLGVTPKAKCARESKRLSRAHPDDSQPQSAHRSDSRRGSK